jgi:hypothetical protein
LEGLLEYFEKVDKITCIQSTNFNEQNFILSCGGTDDLKLAVHVPDKAKGLTPLGKLFNYF